MSDELNDMQDFVLEDEQQPTTEQEFYDPLDTLVEHDFSSEEELNLDESYEMLNIIERESKQSKALESENIIKELGDIYLEEDYRQMLDKTIENVKSFIKKYNIEKEDYKDMCDSEKNKLYAIGSFLMKNVSTAINDLLFSITLEREEYKFIHTTLKRKLTYDGNEVFNIIELNEKFLKEWELIDKSLPKEVPSFIANIDIKNVVMLYHFLGKHTVKGMDKEFYTFASVLKKIADTNKLFNAYNVIQERLSTDFRIWIGAMDPQEVEGQVMPPQQELPPQA